MIDLRLGDCLEVMKTLPDGSVDAVVTDPPYFLPAQHYQTRKVFRKNFSDLGILEHFFRDFFDEMKRILRASGCFYVFCDGQSYPLFWYYAFQMSKSVRPLIWDKGTSINGYFWRHQHELILFGEMPESRPLPTGDGDILRARAVPVDTREHPAEKPAELLGKITSKCGDLVLDPFMGSGTTGVACVQTGRSFIGIEIDAGYFAIAQKRIAEAQLQMRLPLDGA
jgi:site-specific DNA-methyltransferase (adenine-specific)